jgi:glucose/arabinose dehydrogenase
LKNIIGATILLLLLALAWTGCDESESPGTPGDPPVYNYALEIAFPDLFFDDAVDLQNAGDGSDRLFVVEKAGRIRVFVNADTVATTKTFLDITSGVATDGLEKGLLGLAFHPDYATNGQFFVFYTPVSTGVVRIASYEVSATDPDSADASSEAILLDIPHSRSNHNGGQLAFGPDHFLYVSVGDGGGGGDPDDNGQNRATLPGAILRLDVDSQDLGNYGIPAGNPFEGNLSGYREEIFVFGLRNPWRFSFDPVSGWLWVGDVGQRRFEEINVVESGKNYGWDCREGAHEYGTDPSDPGAPSVVCPSPDMVDPVWEYGRDLGNSVTGGHVYRGTSQPSLAGLYIYADYGSGRVWTLEYDGTAPPVGQEILAAPFLVSSFGVDEAGELYLLQFEESGNIHRLIEVAVTP